MGVVASTGKATRLLARDDELEVRLETELPRPLAVGAGNAIFVYGSCFHRSRGIRNVRLLVDGRAIRPMAQGMPRRDLFEAGRPYRSAFWGIAAFEPTPRPRVAELRVAALLDDGSEVAGDLAALELEPSGASKPTAWRDGSASDEPLVAICMATYDPPLELFRRQIESIRDQTHARWVCVISDDHSDPARFEELEAVLNGDPRFVLSKSPRRLGFYRNFERALATAPAEAEYVTLADQDDRWDPSKLEVLVSSLGDAQLTYSDARVVGPGGEPISGTYWSRRRTNHTNLASLLVSNTITGAASLFRRELLERVLPFPPRLGTQWHDHWIALVALAMGDVNYVDRPLYDYVQHRDAVVGHAVANEPQRRGFRERLRMLLDDWRAALGGWCWKYFYGVCRMLLFARVLDLRCGEALRGPKRRALSWFLAIDRSPLGYAWLALRRVRRLAGLNETLGGEQLFLQGIAWRRLISLLTWGRSRPSSRLLKDASLPPAGGADAGARSPEPIG
ncbi:MAG: glycosyltransferase [Solirubrobacterales bacterium]